MIILLEENQEQIQEIFDTTEAIVNLLRDRGTPDLIAIVCLLNIVVTMHAVLDKRNKKEAYELKNAVEKYLKESWGKF